MKIKIKSTKRKQRTRYFWMPQNDIDAERIVVFVKGKEPGVSYFRSGNPGPAWWTFKEMEDPELGVKSEISRAEALKIISPLP